MPKQIHWRAVLLMSATFASAAVAAVVVPIVAQLRLEREQRAAREPHPILVTEEEQLQLVRQILLERRKFHVAPLGENGRLMPVAPGPMVLLDTSVVLCDPTSPDRKPDPECREPPSFFSFAAIDYDNVIPRKLRIELVHANEKRDPIRDPGIPEAILRPRAQIEALVRVDAWESFFRAYPEADGYIEFSRAVRSEDGRYALIYVQRFCHGTCFSAGDLHYFVRSGNGWRRIGVAGIWVS